MSYFPVDRYTSLTLPLLFAADLAFLLMLLLLPSVFLLPQHHRQVFRQNLMLLLIRFSSLLE